ncbi:phosphohydrolase [Candidatus Parcubacteria bacterium]|nr:MAG: phosphohydrolase [Candidatus Parcubacteria bacterium]
MNIIDKAAKIMLAAHKNQTRKTDGSPYVAHPMMVAKKLARLDLGDEVVAAALLHDVLEDTDFDKKNLQQEVGDKVYQIVLAVSEDKEMEWEDRKQKYIDTVINSPEEVKFVSIADKIHNLESLINTHQTMGPAIWEKFNRGKDKKMWFEKKLLEGFKKTWSHDLVDEYEKLIKKTEELT